MDIQSIIDTLLVNSEEIKKAYPTVSNIRHQVMDIPYAELKQFAKDKMHTIHTDNITKRAFVIHTPLAGNMDTDIWLYSTVLKIIPAQIIEDNEQGEAY